MANEEDQKEAMGFSKTIMNKKNTSPSTPSASSSFTDLNSMPPENQSVSL